VQLRTGNPADHEFVASLSKEVFTVYGDYEELLPRWLETPGIFTIIAEEDGARLGFLQIGFFRDGEVLYADVLSVAVSPGAQRRGIARTLLSRAFEASRAGGAREVRLTVADTNQRAQAVFRAAGFELRGELGHYDGGQRSLKMVRPLED
jgi:ribosomal-protein-alanine N-acetyltransferase